MVTRRVNGTISSSRRHPLVAVMVTALVTLPMVLVQSSQVQVASAATTTDLRLDVISARDSTLRPPRGDDACAPYRGMHLLTPFAGTPTPPAGCTGADIPAPFTYKWIINEDNTGDPHQASTANGIDAGDTTTDGSDVCRPQTATNPDGDPLFPANCQWPSIHPVESSAVITQGDSTDWNLADAINSLPDGKYLVSVSADGYEIGGAHFQVPMPVTTAGPGIVKVGLNPYPIPLGTIQVKVFEDNAPADGTFDATTEHGLANWGATVNDILGQVSTDWYGNPICTEYERMVPSGLLALAPPAPPSATMSPTEALMFYGTGGPGAADARAFYGQGNPDYVFSYADYLTWGVGMAGGEPVLIPGTGGKCLSDADGIIRVPNMGTNRYSITVAPPGDSDNEGRWSETTTLEGGHDSDFWMMANDSGLDAEMVQAGEPVPWAQFGFVDTKAATPITADTAATGEIKGTVLAAEPYVPGQGGLAGQGGANGQSGIRYPRTLPRVMVGLNDFDNGDQLGYVTENNADGTFDITHVKDGTYLMSFWDIDQDYAFDVFNVTIVGGQMVDLGNVPLIVWFTRVTGHVFVDTNANGKMDPGEKGVPNFDVTIKNRTNDLYVSGQNLATTDFWGAYHVQEGYPTGAFIIEEFFNTRYKTTGVTYQADNDPQEHTTLTAAVDLSLLPIIGQDGRVDVGVLPYDTAPATDGDPLTPCADTCQGGIVATVAYDATRNELLPDKAATEDYEPGIPGIDVNIAAIVPCAGPADDCDESGRYELAPDGSFAQAPLAVGDNPVTDDVAPGNVSDSTATYRTEEWHRPSSCIPRDSNGIPVVQDAIRNGTTDRTVQDCVEATEQATTFGFADGDDPVSAADGQQVDGNYGFVTYHAGDYLVSVDIPEDPIFHRPMYNVRTAEPINVFSGDVYVPQGADLTGLHFQDFLKANRGDPSVPQLPPGYGVRDADSTTSPYPDAKCVGPLVHVEVDNPATDAYNPDLHNVGGSPYEGQDIHSCSVKLVHVEPGQSVAPNFSLYTDVPIPSKFWGYVTDDVSVSTDRRSTSLGEVQGVADVPVGLYDWTNRLLTTVDTDYNGLFEVLMPSTNSYNCPVPAGPCAGMYRFVGNDPGQPQRPNLNYKPIYRTIAANFQAWPGIFTSADTAPTRATIQIEGPGSQFAAAVVCKAAVTEPQLFRVDWPYAPNPSNFNTSNSESTGTIEIYGEGFGAAPGTLTLTNDAGVVTTYSGAPRVPVWSDTHIELSIPLTGTGNLGGGAYQLHVQQAAASGGLTTVDGLTIHVLKSPYTTVAANRNVTMTTQNAGTNLAIPLLALFLGQSFSQADVGAHITGSGIPANATIAKVIDVSHAQLSVNALNGATASRTIIPDSFVNRFPDVIHVGPLSTLHRIDAAVSELPPNEPYNNWSETSRPSMYTPIDPTQFYFPGPIQKAVNYGWDRYLNVPSVARAVIEAALGPNDPARAAALQAVGAKNRHPLVVTYPRFDNNPVTGAPATDPATGLPSYDPDDPALAFNASGAYYESPVMFYPVKIQGAGPGGIYPDTSGGATGPIPVYGSVVDGQYYNAATNKPEGNTSDLPDQTAELPYDPSLFAEPYAALWENFVVFQLESGAAPGDPTIPSTPSPLPSWFAYGWDGQQAPTEGEVFYVLAHNGDYTSSYKAAIDGFTITGGDQKGFPGNRNEVGGGRIANAPGETGTAPDENFVLDIQGGAIMANAYARFLRITNNTVIANSGASGAIRIGTPQLGTDTEDGNPEGDPATGETFPGYDQQNTDLRLAYNRITANGGTSLGGALALFNGSERYHVDHNEFCGNFSAEYGGAISHFGLSKNGEIDHNKIYLNESVDEGAGIMIAGEPHLDPATAIPLPGKLSNGSGPVKIHDNYIAANLAGDDGGGLRFLQAGNWQADVYNNMITNNISTHEGGGVALDDATNVRIYNDTIAKNLTTATAVTSTGAPAPAGLSTGDNSTELMACSAASPTFTRTRGRTINGSATYQLQAGAPASSNFIAADVGATLVSPNVPAGAQIVSVAANGRSVGLNEPATATSPATASPGLTFSVFRDCSGMPPQAGGATSFSEPLLFNDVFDDNRAGNWQSTGTTPGVHGIGLVTGETIFHWDMGTADGTGTLSPTNSIINDVGGHGFNASPTNQVSNGAPGTNLPKFKAPYDIGVTVSPWRVNPRFRPTSIVGVSLPANAIGDYHLLDASSPAVGTGAVNKNVAPFGSVNAPSNDIDADPRGAPIDEGADEVRTPTADLTITKSHSPAGSVAFGAAVTYTVTVHNNGPDGVVGAPVTDNFPSQLNVTAWGCTATAGSSCTATGSGNSRGGTVSLANGGTATYTATTTASPATKTLPSLTTLDSFTRANAANLGANWTQPNNAVAVNTQQAVCSSALLCTLGAGVAYWNGTSPSGPTYGAHQGAAFTFANAPLNGSELLMAVTGTPSSGIYPSGVRVQYNTSSASVVNTATVSAPAGTTDSNTANNSQNDSLTVSGNRVLVSTTTNSGGAWNDLGSVGIPTGSFAIGNTLTAVINADGTVDVWKTNGGTTYLGSVPGLAAAFTTGGRVGLLLPNSARADDFKGGTVP